MLQHVKPYIKYHFTNLQTCKEEQGYTQITKNI